jgi:predicted Ser/Thr protein kinase
MGEVAERFQKVEEIFNGAIDLEEAERENLIAQRCGNDADLKERVRRMIAACRRMEELNAARCMESAEQTAQHQQATRAGPYALNRLLGRGGMGAVYLAHRADGQFERQVAVKLIDLQFSSGVFRERFRQERQILAALEHPYIARLLDGGVTDGGELYLVMEYVEGLPIHRVCTEQHLNERERVDLSLRVAEAVQFVHQSFIVHRDLKPENILVAADGAPRLLDFSTAKLISPAFAGFADSQLPQRLHAALIEDTQQDRLVGHISRDSTEIEAREKPQSAPVEAAPVHSDPKPQRKPGRPQKGEQPAPPEPTRIERQANMTLAEMLDELPKACNVGTKKNSKGYKKTWVGYKLHIDAADGQIPISCILTSASLHDSQAAIPLAQMTARQVISLYDVMDSAYDAAAIHEYSRSLGHIPLIDVHPRRDQALKEELQAEQKRSKLLNFNYAEDVRYRERTTVERVNARLKNEFGGRMIRVRGHAKVMCHLMFGILALAADQILRLVT